jgi:hypothetical protein
VKLRPVAGGAPDRAIPTLVVLAAALGVAFAVAPAALAGSWSGVGVVDERHLVDALQAAFVGWWCSGVRDLPPDLQAVLDYGFGYHVVRGVIAAVLLVVLVALGVRLARAFVAGGRRKAGRQIALAASGVLVAVLGLFIVAAVTADVAGVVAPFAALFPLLLARATGSPSPHAQQLVKQGLLELRTGPRAGQAPPALQVMIGDYARYHQAMAVLAGAVAVVLLGTGVVMMMRGTRSSERRARRVLGSFTAFSVLVSLVAVVVALVNTLAAHDPVSPFSALFGGGW